jgi:hypothetical protein
MRYLARRKHRDAVTCRQKPECLACRPYVRARAVRAPEYVHRKAAVMEFLYSPEKRIRQNFYVPAQSVQDSVQHQPIEKAERMIRHYNHGPAGWEPLQMMWRNLNANV